MLGLRNARNNRILRPNTRPWRKCYQVPRFRALLSHSWSEHRGSGNLGSVLSVEQGDEPKNHIGEERSRVTRLRNIRDIHFARTDSHCSSRIRRLAAEVGGSIAGLIDKQQYILASSFRAKRENGSLPALYLTTCSFCSTASSLCSLTDVPPVSIPLGDPLRLPRPIPVEVGHREG